MARASVYRQRKPPVSGRRPCCRPSPRALAPPERAHVLDVLHEDRFVDRAPAAVYAMLLEEGRYLCSIRTMYRLLHNAKEVHERRRQRRHPHREPPRLVATAPNQVWTWDITRLPGPRTVGDLSPLCGAGSVLALRRGLDGGHARERHPGAAVNPQRLPKAGHPARATHPAPGPGRADDG